MLNDAFARELYALAQKHGVGILHWRIEGVNRNGHPPERFVLEVDVGAYI